MTTKNQFRKKAQHKIDKLQAKIDLLKQQMADCNRDADEEAIANFEKQLAGAVLQRDGEAYFVKARVVRKGDSIQLPSKWLCIGQVDLPCIGKFNPYGSCYDRQWFLNCLYDGKFKIYSGRDAITEIINKGIAEYEDAYERIMLAINACHERHSAPNLNGVTEKQAYQTLLNLNGALYERADRSNDQYLWFRVVDIGDGTIFVKWYLCDFSRHSDSPTSLPEFYEGKIFPNVRVYPFEKKTMSVLREIRKVVKDKYTEFKPADSWEAFDKRMAHIKECTTEQMAYVKNNLIDYILDPTPDPTAEA